MATVIPPSPLPPDDNVNPTLLGISGTLIGLVLITSALRLWVRFRLRSLGWDDHTMAVVTVLAVTRFGVQVAQGAYGNGRHRWYLDKDDYVTNNALGWFAQILLFASICLLKCSIMLLILRIKDSKKLKITLYSIMAGLVVTNFGCIIILLAECDPVSAYWTGVGKCWPAKIRIYYIYLTICTKLPRPLQSRSTCPLTPVISHSLLCPHGSSLFVAPAGSCVERADPVQDQGVRLCLDGPRSDVSIKSNQSRTLN